MDQPEKQRSNWRRWVTPKTVTAAVIAALALSFVIQNTNEGRVDFLFWNVSMPAWIWIALVFVAGVAVGSLFPWFRPKRR